MKINFQKTQQHHPTIQEGVRVQYGAGKRIAFRFRWYLILFLVISPLLLFVWYATKGKITVEAEGVLTTEPIVLKADNDAIVASISVVPGEFVTEKTPLLSLNRPVLLSEINEVEHAVEQLEQEVGANYGQKEQLLQQEQKTAEQNLADKTELYKKFDSFRQTGGVLQLEQWATVSELAVNAKMKVLNVQESLVDLAQEKLTGSAQQYLNQLNLRLAILKTQMSQLHLSAQSQGEVKDVLVKPGMMVLKGDPLLVFANQRKPKVIAYMDPSDMSFSKLGQQATVTLPNGESLSAVVCEPTKMAETIPPQLADPFEDKKSALKVVLELSTLPSQTIEGLTVQVRFHYNETNFWQHLKTLV